ncbi:hypothetical protein Anapl_03444 [Anas platyrhynchos]|uniref:Uncharacterized protein n=1 Tax=Anas platyrhynchos TaxID=8839 RepID=R0LL75_ANAPL|nr:hypothetical protein Anapl_03444 [Anas platyrhynchos]
MYPGRIRHGEKGGQSVVKLRDQFASQRPHLVCKHSAGAAASLLLLLPPQQCFAPVVKAGSACFSLWSSHKFSQATGGKHDTLPAAHPEPNVYFQAVGSYPDVASSAVGAQTAKSPKAGSNNRVRRAQQQELQGQRMEVRFTLCRCGELSQEQRISSHLLAATSPLTDWVKKIKKLKKITRGLTLKAAGRGGHKPRGGTRHLPPTRSRG